jgi:hypothetical protein
VTLSTETKADILPYSFRKKPMSANDIIEDFIIDHKRRTGVTLSRRTAGKLYLSFLTAVAEGKGPEGLDDKVLFETHAEAVAAGACDNCGMLPCGNKIGCSNKREKAS